MPTVSLRAHPGLQSKRYVHIGVDVGEKFRPVELTQEVIDTLKEFSSGRIIAEVTDANLATLATAGLAVDESGLISSLDEQNPIPKSGTPATAPPHARMHAAAATPAQASLPTSAEPSHSSRRR